MDILIKNMEMPAGGKIIDLTICSDGSVINNLPDAGGKMSSYRSEKVKAVALPEHGDLKDYGSLGNKMVDKMERRKRTWHPFYYEGFKEALKMLDSAPTIVEATE